MSTDERYLTINEAAQMLGVAPETIRRRIKQGNLPHELIQGKYGPEYRIPESAIRKMQGASHPRADTEIPGADSAAAEETRESEAAQAEQAAEATADNVAEQPLGASAPPTKAEPAVSAEERTADERILAGVAHIATLFSFIGLLVALVIYILNRRRSRFVAEHAKQAVGLQVAMFLLCILSTVAVGGGFILMNSVSGIGGALVLFTTIALVGIGTLLRWLLIIWAAVAAFQGDEHRHPVIGGWIARVRQKA